MGIKYIYIYFGIFFLQKLYIHSLFRVGVYPQIALNLSICRLNINILY